MSRFERALCKCGLHAWSAVEPGNVHLTNSDFPIIGVLWAQVGTQECIRPSCTATRQIVREGEFGYDGLNITAGGCHQVTSLDKTTGWGYSRRSAKEVSELEVYDHPVALERLGAIPPMVRRFINDIDRV